MQFLMGRGRGRLKRKEREEGYSGSIRTDFKPTTGWEMEKGAWSNGKAKTLGK